MCGKETILQPVGVNFLERGIEPIEKLGDMVLPKIMSYKEALIKATSVMKVCENCNYGEEVSRTEIHYWIPDIDEQIITIPQTHLLKKRVWGKFFNQVYKKMKVMLVPGMVKDNFNINEFKRHYFYCG